MPLLQADPIEERYSNEQSGVQDCPRRWLKLIWAAILTKSEGL